MLARAAAPRLAAAAGAAAARIVAARLHCRSRRARAPWRSAARSADSTSSRPHRPDSFDGFETEVLLLGHLDRDRLERVEKGRAAQRAPAGAVAAEHLGLVAHADLTHLDAGAELRRQLANQLAEIDSALGSEIEHQPRPVERLLDPRQLHRQPALPHLHQRDAMRLTLALLLRPARDDVLVRGQADRAVRRISRHHTPSGYLRIRADHDPEGGAVFGLHHDGVADLRRRCRRLVRNHETLRPAYRRQLDRDNAWRIHGRYALSRAP